MELVTFVRIVIVVILVGFFFSGMKRGLIRQCLGIIGFIAAFIGAFYFAHYLAGYFEDSFGLSYKPSVVISAVLLFVGILIGFHFVGIASQKIIKITPLGIFDRIGGGVLGVVKGVLLVSLLLIIFFSLPLSGKYIDRVENDKLVKTIHPVLPVFFDLILSISPSELEFKKVMRNRGADEVIERIKKKASEAEEKIDREKEKL